MYSPVSNTYRTFRHLPYMELTSQGLCLNATMHNYMADGCSFAALWAAHMLLISQANYKEHRTHPGLPVFSMLHVKNREGLAGRLCDAMMMCGHRFEISAHSPMHL